MAKDIFPNIKVDRVVMSAANTETYEEFDVGLNIFDKVGLIIERVEYQITSSTIELMTASGDNITCAITSSDGLSSLAADQAEVIDQVQIMRMDFGTAGSGELRSTYIVHDFSGMGGGGLLVAPKPLYFAMGSSGLASAGTSIYRVYFRIMRLSDAEYLELLETRRAFG